MKLPRQLSIRNVGADEGRDRQGGRRAEEEGDLPDSADVLDSVGGAKSKVLRGQQQVTSLMSNGLPTHVYQDQEHTLFNPNLTLSPSNLKACNLRCNKCCSKAVAMVDYTHTHTKQICHEHSLDLIITHRLIPDSSIVKWELTFPLALSPVNQMVAPC